MQRTITHLTDEEGNRIVHVPLDDNVPCTKYAIVDEIIFEDLCDMGLSPMWRIKPDRNRERVVVWNRETEGDTPIARLIMDAGKKQSVVHANGNPFDLRATI